MKLADYAFPPFPGVENSSLFSIYPKSETNGWLTRGFSWMYSYHYKEAEFCFQQARATVDNQLCPLALWGIANCNMPNYNNPDGDMDSIITARKHAKSALEMLPLVEKNVKDGEMKLGLKVQRGLIEAMMVHFPDSTTTYPPCRSIARDHLRRLYALQLKTLYDAQVKEHITGGSVQIRDPNVSALFGESILLQRPWKLYSEDQTKKPVPSDNIFLGTELAVKCLREELNHHPNHPGLLHFVIHATEGSLHPEDTSQDADRLKTQAASTKCGHLIHMPAHIFSLIGDWGAALSSSIQAWHADVEFFMHYNQRNNMQEKCIYPAEKKLFNRQPSLFSSNKWSFVMYSTHDIHTLIYSAMFCGKEETAVRYANEITNEMRLAANEYPMMWSGSDGNNGVAKFLESHIPIILHVLVRFGKWEEILALNVKNYGFEKQSAKDPRLISRCSLHYARAMALTNTNKVTDAKSEMAVFKKLLEKIRECPTDRWLHNNTMADILSVAEQVLEGEILYREAFILNQQDAAKDSSSLQIKTKFDSAFSHLREAVRVNDCLAYDEPWGWMHPPRHILGAFLLEQGYVAEAELVYREDLGMTEPRVRTSFPNNIYSLRGLEECFNYIQTMQGMQYLPKDYDVIMGKLKDAEKLCDNPASIPASCACKQTWVKTQNK